MEIAATLGVHTAEGGPRRRRIVAALNRPRRHEALHVHVELFPLTKEGV
jgi:hypothetical protein